MLALEVHINGKRRCLAGIADDGVVSAILSWVGRGRPERGLPREDVSIRVGGLDSERREHMDWLQQELAAEMMCGFGSLTFRRLSAPSRVVGGQ